MEKVTSADGTTIALERFGEGDPLIVVAGAMVDRVRARGISERLGEDFATINYDRRGRGDSGDAEAYAVEREIEDLAALIEVAGGSALVYAHSSGAALGLQAAAAGLAITRLVAHEAPYHPRGTGEPGEAKAYAEGLDEALAAGDRGDAVELFLGTTGMPAEMIKGFRSDPSFAEMEALAPTLAYDAAVMGSVENDAEIPDGMLAKVTAPTLAIYGTISAPRFRETAETIAAGVADGHLVALEGQHHVVPPDVLAPVLVDFFAEGGD
jgi:pimeloyl-ACP methyl ester carboxylesterase